MKISLLLGVMTALIIGGYGSDIPKSTKEYQKLSKVELDAVFDRCWVKVKDSSNYPNKGEIDDMVGAILQSHGNAAGDLDSEKAEQGYAQADLAILWLSWYGLITDKELAKFGNDMLAEYVRYGRVVIAANKSGRSDHINYVLGTN